MKIRVLAEKIGAVGLPATGYPDIRDKVNATLDPMDTPVTTTDIATAISFIRCNADELGWTIPHCRRGPITDEDRLQMLLVDRDGDFFVASDGRQDQLRDGTISSLATVAQMMQNHGAAIQMGVAYQRSTILKRELRSWLADMQWMSQKAKSLADALRLERDGEAA